MSELFKIFNSTEESEIKNSFKGILTNQFRQELEELNIYLMDITKVENLITETYKEILTEIKEEMKTAIKKKVYQAINFDNIDVKQFIR